MGDEACVRNVKRTQINKCPNFSKPMLNRWYFWVLAVIGATFAGLTNNPLLIAMAVVIPMGLVIFK